MDDPLFGDAITSGTNDSKKVKIREVTNWWNEKPLKPMLKKSLAEAVLARLDHINRYQKAEDGSKEKQDLFDIIFKPGNSFNWFSSYKAQTMKDFKVPLFYIFFSL